MIIVYKVVFTLVGKYAVLPTINEVTVLNTNILSPICPDGTVAMNVEELAVFEYYTFLCRNGVGGYKGKCWYFGIAGTSFKRNIFKRYFFDIAFL